MNEQDLKHGVIRRNPIVKIVQKLWRQANGQKIGKAATPFDWVKGFDIRDIIGSINGKDQGKNYSCGRQAAAYFVYIQERLRGVIEGEISAKGGYGVYCAIGGGMSVTSLMTDVGAWGAVLEATVPSYDAYGKPLPEFMMEDTSYLSDALRQDATTRAGYTPFDIAEDFETSAQTIQNYGAIIVELQGTDNGTWLSAFPQITSIGKPKWYHYMCFCIAKTINNKRYLGALTSWGKGVGENGIQYFGEEWFTNKRVIDCFTFIHDSQVQPIPTATPTIWQALAIWFRSIWLSKAVKTT
jgi:hypothetical protein